MFAVKCTDTAYRFTENVIALKEMVKETECVVAKKQPVRNIAKHVKQERDVILFITTQTQEGDARVEQFFTVV